MAKQTINDAETGLVVRTKLNDNFTELYQRYDPAPYNWTPDRTHGIRKKIAQALSGRAATKFVFFGDSTTFGTVGGTSLASNTLVSRPYRLYQYLKAQGLNVRYDGVTWGSIVTANGAASTLDARISAATGWGGAGSAYMGTAPGNLTAPVIFTPAGSWDTAVVTYYDVSAGTLRLQVDSETAVDVTLTGSATFKTATVTTTAGAAGAKAVKVFMTTGRFCSIDCHLSASPDLRILNYGFPGTGFLTSAAPSSSNSMSRMIAATAPDICSTAHGVNDFGSNNAAGWQTNYASHLSIVTSASHMLEMPLMNAGVTDAIQNTYVTALYALADSNSLPLINWRNRYGNTNALVSSNGWQADALHPGSDTYQDQGMFLGKSLVGMHG